MLGSHGVASRRCCFSGYAKDSNFLDYFLKKCILHVAAALGRARLEIDFRQPVLIAWRKMAEGLSNLFGLLI